jgi:hypothetical protein
MLGRGRRCGYSKLVGAIAMLGFAPSKVDYVDCESAWDGLRLLSSHVADLNQTVEDMKSASAAQGSSLENELQGSRRGLKDLASKTELTFKEIEYNFGK